MIIAAIVDPLGQTATNGYDALNRLLSIDHSAPGLPDVAHAYDANGNRTQMTDGTGATCAATGSWTRSARSATLGYMRSQPIRIGAETHRALRERSEQSGEPIVRLAGRYIDEGMRLDRHPGIVFRDGPAGRRAVVVGGPDVWEIVSAIRSAPERGDGLVEGLAARLGVPAQKIRVAIRYYAEYPDEIDAFIAMVERESGELEQTLERERQLIG